MFNLLFLGRSDSSNINENEQRYCNNVNGVNSIVNDEIDSGATDDDRSSSVAIKRHSLRSTSSFCDEVFLEELANLGLTTIAGAGAEEDAVSYGALSLGAASNSGSCNSNHVGANAAASAVALNLIIEFDEGK